MLLFTAGTVESVDHDADVPSDLIEVLMQDHEAGAGIVQEWLRMVVSEHSRAAPEFANGFFEQLQVVASSDALQIRTPDVQMWGGSIDWSDQAEVAGALQVQCQNTLELLNEEWDRSQAEKRRGRAVT